MAGEFRILIAAALAFALVGQDGSAFDYESADHDLRILHSASRKIGQDRNGIVTFTGTGAPMVIEARSSGFSIAGNLLAGSATIGPDKKYFVQSAHDEGAAKLVIDSTEADRFRAGQAKAAGRPFVPSANSSSMTLTSDTFDYTGTPTLGTLSLSHPFHIASSGGGVRSVRKDGNLVPQHFDQTVDMDGGSGSVTVDPRRDDESSRVKQGTILGKVTFHIVRHEQTEGEPTPTLYDITGSCDRLDFSRSETGAVLHATGHVKIKGTQGTWLGDQIVLTFDPDYQPQQIEATGGPTESRIPVEGAQP